MNTKSYLVFLLAMCVARFVSAKPQLFGSDNCGENESFTICGTACPPRCNVDNSGTLCILPCIVGCQCQPGYLLNDEGNCVLPEDC